MIVWIMTWSLWTGSTSYVSATQNYIDSQLLLQECFANEWIQLVRIAPNGFDKQRQVFTKYALYTKEVYKVVDEEIRIDVVWNRSVHNSSLIYMLWSFLVCPSPQFSALSDDKLQQYTLLKKHQSRTVLFHNFIISQSVQDSFGDMVVLKPRFWSWGVDVQLFKKQDLLNEKDRFMNLKKRMLVQEYIDSSGGIPWLVIGKHDLRVVLLWNTIDHLTVRQPSDSKEFRSNVAVWWTETIFPCEALPKELEKLILVLQERLQLSHELCSLDFSYSTEEKRWYCIEINASPWIEYTEQQRIFATGYYTRLAKYFRSLSGE